MVIAKPSEEEGPRLGRFRRNYLNGERVAVESSKERVAVESCKMVVEVATVPLDPNLMASVLAEGRMTISAFMSVEVIGSR
jgi:hypothetical protein